MHHSAQAPFALPLRGAPDAASFWPGRNLSPSLGAEGFGRSCVPDRGSDQGFLPVSKLPKATLVSGLGYGQHRPTKTAAHTDAPWSQQNCPVALRRPLSRRRSVKELARAYHCPHERCDRRYEAWRSLQAHLYAKHGERKRKTDYPQFDSLHIRGVTGLTQPTPCSGAPIKGNTCSSGSATPSPGMPMSTPSCSSTAPSSPATLSPTHDTKTTLETLLSGDGLLTFNLPMEAAQPAGLLSGGPTAVSVSEEELDRLVRSILNENAMGTPVLMS